MRGGRWRLHTVPPVGVSSAYIAGVTSGSLSMALKAGVIAAATAVAFNAVGDITSEMPGAIRAPDGSHGTFIPDSEGHLANIAGHALVGCASSATSGGKCGPGALSAAVTGPLINDKTFSVRTLVLNTTIGGFASIAGGGNLVNGAVTGAFGYLFNARAQCMIDNFCRDLAGGGFGPSAAAAAGIAAATQETIKDWLNSDATPDSTRAEQAAKIHGNSADSMQGTELYYLINKSSGEIDKIGITSYPNRRYSPAYLEAENVRYETQVHYQWRYAAISD